jgi:hypothetical protein
MRRIAFWLSLLIPALAVVWGVSLGSFPLGVQEEWTWNRVTPTGPLWLSLTSVLVAAVLYLGFVWLGARRIERSRPWEMPVWISGLVVCGFAWLWMAQEAAPENYQLSKAVWILYYRGSSGYFSEANDVAGDLGAYLAAYEQKMAQGDVLHIGTHPPGLTVAFRGLLGLCREFPGFVDSIAATVPDSVRAAFDALDATRTRLVPLSGAERSVLWLAALLVQALATLTILPLFGLLRLACSRRASWLAVAFWPTMPALAIFLPKADCLYPLLATTFLWLWLTAMVRRSCVRSVLAGMVLWVGMTLSLAFLPIAIVTILAGCWATFRNRQRPLTALGILTPATADSKTTAASERSEGLPRRVSMAGWGSLGFTVPCLLTWCCLKLNLLTVWCWNFENHAGFYHQFSRTYWKWLAVNPIELIVAVGAPLAVLAAWSIAGPWRRIAAQPLPARPVGYVWAWLLTLGLLWLSGKNMGEAARLWILFMPVFVWAAGPAFEAGCQSTERSGGDLQLSAFVPTGGTPTCLAVNGWCVALAVQLVTTAAMVTQVAGFHYPITGT